MKIQTMSVVVGTKACNAKCPFCVSRLTGNDMPLPLVPNWRNFKKACCLASKAGATTILLTGKGEPTLYPDLIVHYLEMIKYNGYEFPFIEMQTNGMGLWKLDDYLRDWYHLGMTTVALSAVSIGCANKKIYGVNYPSLETTSAQLHKIGFTVRLGIMMLKDYVCKPSDIDDVVDFCKANKIKQLTLRPISKPENGEGDINEWVTEHTLSDDQLRGIHTHIIKYGMPVLHLAHGAVVYDYKGQNLCLANCLTTNDTDENMRQIIYYPDGTISYDWVYPGAVLL